MSTKNETATTKRTERDNVMTKVKGYRILFSGESHGQLDACGASAKLYRTESGAKRAARYFLAEHKDGKPVRYIATGSTYSWENEDGTYTERAHVAPVYEF